MGRKRIKGTKYNRVTKQQKYIFLKLCIAEKQSIHEAAFNSGIHYSTAKTILFFHKKQYKNYSTYIVNDPNQKTEYLNAQQAVWKEIPINVDQSHQEKSTVEIIVNSKHKLLESRRKAKRPADSLSDQYEECEKNVKIQKDEKHLPHAPLQDRNFEEMGRWFNRSKYFNKNMEVLSSEKFL